MEKHIVLPTSPCHDGRSCGAAAWEPGNHRRRTAPAAAGVCRSAHAEFRQARYIMGTIVEIVVAAPHKHTAEQAMEHGFQALRQVEQRMSIYQSTSALSHINRLAADTWVPLEADLFTVIAAALDVARQSDGALDDGSAADAFVGFVQQAGRVPTASEIAATLPLVDYRHVQLDLAHSAIRFTRKGMGLISAASPKDLPLIIAYKPCSPRGSAGPLSMRAVTYSPWAQRHPRLLAGRHPAPLHP